LRYMTPAEFAATCTRYVPIAENRWCLTVAERDKSLVSMALLT
jgi:hypothetical protein